MDEERFVILQADGLWFGTSTPMFNPSRASNYRTREGAQERLDETPDRFVGIVPLSIAATVYERLEREMARARRDANALEAQFNEERRRRGDAEDELADIRMQLRDFRTKYEQLQRKIGG